MKIVINKCFGGFGLSDAAYDWLIKKGVPLLGKDIETKEPAIFRWSDDTSRNKYYDNFTDNNRNHPLLVECVETLGNMSHGGYSDLKVVEIPDNVEWIIQEYDGYEHIAEKHRTWY